MPANAVKPGQEDEWKRAKKAAAEQGQAGNHALIMYIFKKMIAKKSLRDRLFDMIKARKPVTGQMGLFGGESTPSKPRAVGPFIGPRGGKWADPKHTIPWKEPRHPIPRPVKPQEPEMVMVKDHFTGKVMGPYELVAAKYDPDIVTLKDPATGKKFKVHGDNLAPVPKEATRKEPPTKDPDRPATPEEVEPDIRYTLYSRHPSSNKWMAERSFYGTYFRPGSEGASYFNRNNYTVMKEGVPPPQIAAPPAEERTSHEEGKTIRTTWLERSLKDRLTDKLQKAEPAQARQEFKIKPRPASDKPKPKPGAVQGSVVKPPAGFTPIPHSKKGGYHKQMGGGKFIYWYPGQGIVGAAHEADAKTTPHQEATAKHVMEQIGALEQKGSITRSDLEHTMQAIHNAWPQGPQDVPRHIMEHYKKLQGMVTGAEEETPEVKIKRPGAKPETVQEFKESVVKERAAEKEAKKEAKEKERAVKKEAAAQKREGKRKAAEEKRQAERKAVRAKVITDHKKVPEGFNKMSKKERAKLTANWDQVKEDLENNYAKGDYMSHPDMRQAITEHIDELADVGQIVPANSGKAKSMLLKQLEYGEKAGIKRQALASLLEENVRKLAHQEVESVKRTLGDHGVRHLSVNAHQANRIFDKLEAAGIRISPMDRFMAGQVMLDHDMGYTIPVIAKGGFAIKDNYHPQASAVLVQQQGAKYRKLFGKDYRDFKRHVETHSGSGVDWKNDPVGSAVRLADNTHLFADKLPEVLFDTDHGVEVLTKLKLADQIVPKSIVTVDKNGKEKRKRTPEEKAEFNALVGGVRDQLAESVKNRADLPESTKKLLANAVAEIGGVTPDFAISRLAGRSPEFEYDKKSGDMKVSIEQSPARLAIGEIFGETEKDKQFKKMLEDFGTNPEAAYDHAPPPSTRVGAEGNGIAFTWREPSGDHPAERRYATVMRDTKARLTEIQAMKGSAKRAALKRFFGDELAKAIAALINEWTMIDGLDELQKASAMSARTGRVRPSGYAPLKEEAKMTLKERLGAAIGRRPQGPGWTAIPGGKRGGYRRMVGGKWAYWYHGMGTQGGTQQEAKQHQAKRDIEHHEKQSTKWQERAAKRHASGQAGEHVESARSKMREHAGHARSLREKHGISAVKSMEKPMAIERSNAMKKGSDAALISKLADKVMGGMELDDAMKQLEGDDAGQKSLLAELRNRKSMGPQDGRGQGKGVQGGRGANRNVESCPEGGPGFGQGKGQGGGRVRKSLRVNTCQVHLEHDAYLAKALDDGDLGIGTVPRTFSSKTMKKAIGGERFTEHGADHREETARAQQAAEIVTYDPDGTDGDGGLPEWFADAQRTQEPMVRTPARMTKAQEPPTRVIDDDDPYTKRLHHMDPRDGAANMDFAYNRDAKRTQ